MYNCTTIRACALRYVTLRRALNVPVACLMRAALETLRARSAPATAAAVRLTLGELVTTGNRRLRDNVRWSGGIWQHHVVGFFSGSRPGGSGPDTW